MGKKPRRSTVKPRPPGHERPQAGKHRVAFALHLRDEGKRHGYIIPELMSRYGISRSQADEDLRRADVIIVERLEAEAPVVAGRMVARLERAIDAAEDAGDTRGMVAAIGELREWHGVGTTVTVKGSAGSSEAAILAAIKLTPAQRNQREAELLKMLGEEDLGPAPASSAGDAP